MISRLTALCSIALFQLGCLSHAQAQTGDSVLTISELASVDWRRSAVSDSLSFGELYQRCHDGHERLHAAIAKDPESFPLHELENPLHKETDQHRRWEYQMKRMPVRVVRVFDLNQQLAITLELDTDTVTFCQTSRLGATLTLEHQGSFPIPSFGFSLQPIKGLNLSNLDILSSPENAGKIQVPNRREVRIHVTELQPGDKVSVDLVFTPDCNGKEGSIHYRAVNEVSQSFEYLVEFSGYQLDFDNKTLFKPIFRDFIRESVILKNPSKAQ